VHALRLLALLALALPILFSVAACDGGGADAGPDAGGRPDIGAPGDAGGGVDGAGPGADSGPGGDAVTPADAAGQDRAAPDDTATPPGDTPGPGRDLPPPGDAAPNTPPTFDPLPTITLAQGRTRTLDLNPYVADAEDPDALLVIGWSTAHVALSDPGTHVLLIVAPVDWHGTEEIPLTVVDRGGLTATAVLTVVVQEGTVQPPDECGVTTFRYPAGAEAQQVLLSGSFNGWGSTPATAAILADADGDGVWEVTLTLAPGRYEYKFVVDGEWLPDPDNPNTTPDGYGSLNSVLVVLPCDDPGPGPDPTCGQASFRYAAGPDVTAVFVAGTFNRWSDTADPLRDPDGDRVFEATLTLDPGRHEYKFVVDGTWLPDPANPDTAPDGFGSVNSVLTVAACPQAGALTLVSHATDADARSFRARFSAAAAVDPALVTVTVDRAPAPAGALTADAAGTTLTLTLTGLATGIHDVRVTSGGVTLLLKVYVGVSTDWRDVVLYFALTDRFANGDRSNDAPVPGVDPRVNYQGGDFAGLQAKLEEGYFDDLGVGAIWLSWPIDNPDGYEDGSHVDQDGCGLSPTTAQRSPMRYTGYHGYWPSRLDRTDEHFGTREELQDLVVAAHARGIRIVLDFTANHVHDSSPLWTEHQGDGWFNVPAQICEVVGWDSAPQTCWFTAYLPDLDFRNAAARAALLEHAIGWAKDVGADGFRLDAVKHIDMQFVRDLRAAVHRELELTGVDFYIVGETFTGDAGLIASFVGPDRLHGQFDFPANLQIRLGFATHEKGLDAMDGDVRAARATYGAGASLMSPFIGNHDIARFISHAAGMIACGVWDVTSNIAQGWRRPPGQPADLAPYEKLRLALTYTWTVPGVPLLYYGDEFGLPGAGDPDNRRFMRFDGELSAHESATLAFVQRLGQARAAHPALRTGALSGALWAEADFLAYARTLPTQRAVVLLNRGGGTKTGTLQVGGVGITDGTRLVDVLGSGAPQTVAGGGLAFSVPARSAAIYVSE
jgi:glycosidase